jgi:hypothetical protein
MLQAATDQMKRSYHYLDEPRDFQEACPETVEGMKGHILLLGCVLPSRAGLTSLSPVLPSRISVSSFTKSGDFELQEPGHQHFFH